MAIGKKTGGRKKGTPNKTTTSVKSALLDAFDRLGGVESLVQWGADNPTQFYQVWSKILPQEVHNTHSGDAENPVMLLMQQITGTKFDVKSGQ
ncbi:MAG: hypothetical protein ACR2IJ_00045 [Fluviibacter sp.]